MNALFNLAQLVAEERAMLRRNWGWFVGLGVVLTVMGLVGLVFAGALSVVTVIFVGWLFLIGGALEVGHAVFRKGWRGFWLDLLSGALTLVAGLFILLRPIEGLGILTMLLGMLFLVGGIFRLGAGVAMNNPYRGWFILHGVISLVLGGLILADWPRSALWVIGTFVAIDLLISGLRLVSFGLEVKKFALIGTEERQPAPAPAPSA
jgi:uncharacterized membrane protein HdeD (DUF308 family)